MYEGDIDGEAKPKISFPFLFPLRGGGVGGGDAGKMQGNFLVLHTRVRERVRGALVRITTQSERTIQFRATTRSARAKWVRAKANTSPQKETSESERWEEARAEGAGVGKRARRFATNWDGTGAAKWTDLSLFHI